MQLCIFQCPVSISSFNCCMNTKDGFTTRRKLIMTENQNCFYYPLLADTINKNPSDISKGSL